MFLPQRDVDPTAEAAAAAQRALLAKYAAPDELGRLSCRFDPRQARGGYLVRRIVVQGPAGSVARIYAGDPDPLNLADATTSGWSDVADYAQPLYVPAYTALVVVWENPDGTDIAGAAVARLEIEDIA